MKSNDFAIYEVSLNQNFNLTDIGYGSGRSLYKTLPHSVLGIKTERTARQGAAYLATPPNSQCFGLEHMDLLFFPMP